MTLKELKKKEKETKRNYIIESAQKLFLSKDYDEVSMNSIAKEVGVNKATLYYYFKNKEALYFAIVLQGVKVLVKMAKEEIRNGKTGYEKISLYGNAMNKFSAEYPGCLKLLYAPQSSKFDINNMASSEEYKKVMGILKDLMFIMRDLIQSGIDDGTIREDVNPMEAAVLMSLISQSMSNMSCLYKDMLKSEGVSEQKFAMDVKGFMQYMLKKS
ncbi:TetR/AcrR family transcriptional regulator [Methanobacterium sp.]|uniref:TetR/AcrR family transcriptional regulator n=1 Tax=Methanobacterium sp. TaxID=2164 RepID=UPI00315939D9